MNTFSDLASEYNAALSGPEAMVANQKAQALGVMMNDFNSNKISRKEFLAGFPAKASEFCSAYKAVSAKELTLLRDERWPSSLETQRAAVEKYLTAEQKQLGACVKTKDPARLFNIVVWFIDHEAEATRVTNELNAKASQLAEVG